ncbi:MAG TPA: DNA-binding response regulator [Sporomusaceae bacterium]|jgi:DNA-binding response OmpR family regulator|uniref:response regulator transcription factor n=1 Tax=Anaerospora sp. TaxID=1960278 RepID=UPI000EDEF8C0|nr:response regulator transcription factor [Anaerospora sp.]HAK73825.1 DNA-binding response regulator [Sporomusaceae bacterium]
MMQPTVLIIDDDSKLTQLVQTYFLKENFSTYIGHDGYQALQLVREKKPDIVILDLMLPGLNGWEVCRQIRKESDVPILMLTARDEENDRLVGLEMGADDYVTKPFSPREVVARAKAILRRTQKGSSKEIQLKVGDLIIDRERHLVLVGAEPLDLTPTEFKIIELLAANRGRVFSRLHIVEQVQGYTFDGYERTIDAHIKNLRRKLAGHSCNPQLIQTVYGIGYKIAGDEYA